MTRSNDDGDEKLSVHCIFIIMSMSIISHRHVGWSITIIFCSAFTTLIHSQTIYGQTVCFGGGANASYV